MYYGSGAGKLPTASAVVGDMIAAVQLKDRPAALGWTGQRLEVLPVRQLPWKYFARFEGSREEKKTLTEELFGKVRWLELAGLEPDHIAVCGDCTACMEDKYWSHRRQGAERGSMAAVIELT